MDLQRSQLDDAVKANIVSNEQAKQLWLFWSAESENIPQFRITHVMYYFGGLLAMFAVTLLVSQSWDVLRGLPLFFISIGLFLLGLIFANYFLSKKLFIPAGVMSTFSLTVIPLAVYNIQYWLGLLPPPNYYYSDLYHLVSWYWVPMEFITLCAGLFMLYRFDFPFLLFPIALVLWLMSMDVWALLFYENNDVWRAMFSIFYGLMVIIAAIYTNLKFKSSDRDYAFWLYIIGVMIFWGGLTIHPSHSELTKFFYFMINFGMIIVSVILNRRVFAIFGAIGVIGYLTYLSSEIFHNSVMFAIALVFIGIAIIIAGTQWKKIEIKLQNKCKKYFPKLF